MYGSYHHISVVGAGASRTPEPLVVAGPLCESGDVFTRDANELLVPRFLPRPEPGDLLVLHDAGAYGSAMSSNYVSLGRVPQVLWDTGRATLVARREELGRRGSCRMRGAAGLTGSGAGTGTGSESGTGCRNPAPATGSGRRRTGRSTSYGLSGCGASHQEEVFPAAC